MPNTPHMFRYQLQIIVSFGLTTDVVLNDSSQGVPETLLFLFQFCSFRGIHARLFTVWVCGSLFFLGAAVAVVVDPIWSRSPSSLVNQVPSLCS
jgi:hypothetical protein